MVCLDSGSTNARNVGSSLVNLFSALLMLSWDFFSAGVSASEITGSGTKIEDRARLRPGVTKVSPDWQSIPNRAVMSPAEASSISSMLSACIRIRRPTRNFWRERVL